ncbi:MAG: hypothetical protein ABR511_05325, partial [Acidimicrobiales bacterium]
MHRLPGVPMVALAAFSALAAAMAAPVVVAPPLAAPALAATPAGAPPLAAPARESAADPAATSTALVIDGHGFGHGVGMPEDGAEALGRAGAGTAQILAAFYPGTAVASRSGTVSVTLLDAPAPSVVVAFPGGGQVLDAPSGPQSPGFPVVASPGGSVRLSFDGSRYHAVPLAGATATAPAPAAPA